jgi:excisionase family DNA binding protein
MDNLFNVNQVAFILKVHPLTVRRYIREEKIKAVKVGGNVRIRETELTAFTREFAPRPVGTTPFLANRKFMPTDPFTTEDPLLQLEGRGASVQLSPKS